MHNLVAFYTASLADATTYTQIAGVADQSMPMDSNGRFIMPGPWQFLAGHAACTGLTNARFDSPSLRTMFSPEIYPGRKAATPGNTNGPITFHGRGPKLVATEGLALYAGQTSGGALAAWGAAWLAPQMVAAPPGPVYTYVGTATITAVAGSWAFGTISFNQTLPAGRYAIVGMGCTAANVLYARLIYPGISNFRPGIVVQTSYGDQPIDDYFRYGRMGSFGEFESTALPQLEILGDAAGAAAPTVYLDLVKTR